MGAVCFPGSGSSMLHPGCWEQLGSLIQPTPAQGREETPSSSYRDGEGSGIAFCCRLGREGPVALRVSRPRCPSPGEHFQSPRSVTLEFQQELVGGTHREPGGTPGPVPESRLQEGLTEHWRKWGKTGLKGKQSICGVKITWGGTKPGC